MRRALGKGLSQLIAEEYEAPSNEVALADIVPNSLQPRSTFDEATLIELAASIKSHGILQPLSVRSLRGGKYELIAGERRFRAAKMAGLKSVPVVVRTADDAASLELALVENIQREDISAMECARAYRQLIDEFKMTQEQVAEKVGKSRTAVANTIRLLKLPDRLQRALEKGELTEGHARALLALANPAQMLALGEIAIARGLSVREVENLVQKASRSRDEGQHGSERKVTAEDAALEEAISIFFGSPARVQRGPRGGRLSVDFYSDDELQHIIEVLGITL